MITLTSRTGNRIPDTKTYKYEKAATRNAKALVDSGVRKQVYLKNEEGATLKVVK